MNAIAMVVVFIMRENGLMDGGNVGEYPILYLTYSISLYSHISLIRHLQIYLHTLLCIIKKEPQLVKKRRR